MADCGQPFTNSMIEIHPDDIFLVSYPKSGNTWLRFLIGNYLTDNQCDFTNSHFIVPDIHYNPEQINQLQKPRFIKSHHPFTPHYHRVIYIARDGRDAAVSYYFYALKFKLINDNITFEDFVLNIIDNSIIDSFTPWSDHIFSWLDQQETANILLVKYEDMLANTAYEFRRILEFSELPIDQARLLKAVEASSFKNMQNLESSQANLFERFKNSNTSIKFVREGSIGGWKTLFSDKLLASFIERHGLALERLGYLTPGITDGFQFRKQQFDRLQNEYDILTVEVLSKQTECQKINLQLEHSDIEYQALQVELRQLQSKFEQAQDDAQKLQLQLDQQLIFQQQLQNQLEKAQARSQKLQAKLTQVQERSQKRQQNLKAQLQQTQAELQAMQSSKVWKLRKLWFKLKKLVGLANN